MLNPTEEYYKSIYVTDRFSFVFYGTNGHILFHYLGI